MIYALWFGGSSYSTTPSVEDLESFPSLTAAKAALSERRYRGHVVQQDFNFVNREAESLYCPCVEDDSRMWIWRAADIVDGVTYVSDDPDHVIGFGPRGGVNVTRG